MVHVGFPTRQKGASREPPSPPSTPCPGGVSSPPARAGDLERRASPSEPRASSAERGPG